MSIAAYIASKTTLPREPETGAAQYPEVEDYDPVLQSHCRLRGAMTGEDKNEP